jgi:hypothetical protein
MRSIFGWDLPPGCTSGDAFGGTEGPIDCPVCVDGVELSGSDCEKDPYTHGPTCPKHGCVFCQDLEKQRVYCQGPFCGDYIHADVALVEGKYCSESCRQAMADIRHVDALRQLQGYDNELELE